jgi:DnaD/phage-associated family protein
MFNGFSDKETFIQVPDSFFRELLNEIEDLEELKVTLYGLWRFEHMEGAQRFLREEDFSDIVIDPAVALEKAIQRGTLIRVRQEAGVLYMLNSPRGRAAAESLAKDLKKLPEGVWQGAPHFNRSNIYKLYEENIGPLTPIIAEALKDAESSYPPDWVIDALETAVKNNKRSWKYVETILRRWKEDGHAKEQNRRDLENHHGRDVTRKVDDFLKR